MSEVKITLTNQHTGRTKEVKVLRITRTGAAIIVEWPEHVSKQLRLTRRYSMESTFFQNNYTGYFITENKLNAALAAPRTAAPVL